MQWAEKVLHWVDNLREEEVPPEWMWPLPWEWTRHLAQVVLDRKDGKDRPADEEAPEPEAEHRNALFDEMMAQLQET